MTLEFNRIGSEHYQQPIGLIVDSYILKDSETSWVLDPPFQRGSVWNLNQKKAWIQSILMGIGLPSLFVNQFDHSHPKYGFHTIVIDGQQRLRATAEFMQDQFPINGEYYSDQPLVFKRGFKMSAGQVPLVICKYKTLKECAELYVKLLTAGTSHTPEEIKKAKDFIKNV